MGKTMLAVYRRMARLSPEVRQYLMGAGQALDFYPQPLTPTFESSDRMAIQKDWEAVGGDMRHALTRAQKEERERAY